eukprot:4439361-Pleurochrysis_carterae.AAC.1
MPQRCPRQQHTHTQLPAPPSPSPREAAHHPPPIRCRHPPSRLPSPPPSARGLPPLPRPRPRSSRPRLPAAAEGARRIIIHMRTSRSSASSPTASWPSRRDASHAQTRRRKRTRAPPRCTPSRPRPHLHAYSSAYLVTYLSVYRSGHLLLIIELAVHPPAYLFACHTTSSSLRSHARMLARSHAPSLSPTHRISFRPPNPPVMLARAEARQLRRAA